MELDVFDTWASTLQGQTLHFDVLVPRDQGINAKRFARQWLEQIGYHDTQINIERCRYCHSEDPGPEILHQVKQQGFFILQLEGCPAPV